MKNLILFSICLLNTIGMNSQTIFNHENFNASIFSYQVVKNEGVSQKDFERGSFIFNEARNAVAEHNMDFTCADYWNFAMAFIRLGESKENIEIAFQKGIDCLLYTSPSPRD